MKSFALGALLVLNLGLAIVVLDRKLPDTTANAQYAGRPGDYLMIPGNVLGSTNAVVYVVDQSDHMLSAMSYDDSNGTITTMPPLNLDHIFANMGRMNRR